MPEASDHPTLELVSGMLALTGAISFVIFLLARAADAVGAWLLGVLALLCFVNAGALWWRSTDRAKEPEPRVDDYRAD